MHACLRAMSARSRSGSPHDDLHRTGLCLLVCDCWSGVGTVVEPEWVLAVLTAITIDKCVGRWVVVGMRANLDLLTIRRE